MPCAHGTVCHTHAAARPRDMCKAVVGPLAEDAADQIKQPQEVDGDHDAHHDLEHLKPLDLHVLNVVLCNVILLLGPCEHKGHNANCTSHQVCAGRGRRGEGGYDCGGPQDTSELFSTQPCPGGFYDMFALPRQSCTVSEHTSGG